MKRADWMVVGLRLYGLYLIVGAVLGLFDLLATGEFLDGALTSPIGAAVDTALDWRLGRVVLTSFLGTTLCLGASGITAWFEERDARGRDEATAPRPNDLG